jgi:SAM-dependent methyltransferase
VSEDPGQWAAAAGALADPRYRLWRDHSDAVNLRLCDRWLGEGAGERALKTDLFDEAVGRGLFADLRGRFPGMIGIDVSAAVARSARRGESAPIAAAADVRRLPFADASFDAVLSISTLDHFRRTADITASLRELHRVLRPEGRLVLTLDNPANPKILLRGALPWTLLRRTGAVPYFVGKSLRPRRLERELARAGFVVLELDAIVHCPRVLAVAMSKLPLFVRPRARAALMAALDRCERLSSWPTRFLTGHFTAVLARRPR